MSTQFRKKSHTLRSLSGTYLLELLFLHSTHPSNTPLALLLSYSYTPGHW